MMSARSVGTAVASVGVLGAGTAVWLMVLGAGAAKTAGADTMEWWLAPSTQKVFADDSSTGVEEAVLWAARGEYESVQLVLRSDQELEQVAVAYQPLGEPGEDAMALPAEWVELFEAWYVNTPGVARWGFPEGKPERRRPRYPDSLVPLVGGDRDGTVSLEAGQARAIWVRVRVPRDAAAGQYHGRIVVQMGPAGGADGPVLQAPVTVNVWPFEIPPASSLRTAAGITSRDLERFHGVERSSAEADELYRIYYDALLDYRICAYYLPYRGGDGPSRFTNPAAEQYLLDERVNSFIAGYSGEEQFMRDLVEYFRGLGVLHKAWLYNVDEPASREAYQVLANQARYVQRVAPDLPMSITFYVGPEWDRQLTPMDVLADEVSLWVCQTDYYAHGHGLGTKVQEQMRERHAAGDETWLYVAAGPREPFCNWFINNSALQHRILMWQVWSQQIISGLLYWRATHWHEVEDPYEDVGTVKGIDPHLYGDGMLFYPGARFGIHGPVGSVRLECIRDGLEDYEYLVLAEQLLGREEAMRFVSEVTTEAEGPQATEQRFTRYTEDPSLFADIRQRLGERLAESVRGR